MARRPGLPRWRGRSSSIARVGLPRAVLAGSPGAVRNHRHQHHAARDGQTNLQTAHAQSPQASLSAMFTADSMSTATMRETPCSCMVTPMSCSAISMAILLWEMNKN